MNLYMNTLIIGCNKPISARSVQKPCYNHKEVVDK